MEVDPADLGMVGDIAREFGKRPQTVSNWVGRYPNFPKPVARLSNGNYPIYSMTAVRKWYEQFDATRTDRYRDVMARARAGRAAKHARA